MQNSQALFLEILEIVKKRETILITFSMSMSCWSGICFNLDINFSVGSFNISYKFQVIHILYLNIPFSSTFLFIYPSVIFSVVFCFEAALRLGETWPFAVNTKLSLVRAMKLCKIHSRTFESQCTKRCPNLLNFPSVRLNSGSRNRVLHSLFPASRKSLFQCLQVSFWDSQVEHLWTPSYSVLSVLVVNQLWMIQSVFFLVN